MSIKNEFEVFPEVVRVEDACDLLAVVVVTAMWLAAGPAFHFSDTWQLTMNTFASQVTFLIAFLLQNTQNRDTRSLQLKLDELLRATQGARTSLVNLERLSDEELAHLKEEFERISQSRAERR